MSQVAASEQSQLGMIVQGCWQAKASVQGKHMERPDALAKEPGPQQLHEAWPIKGLKDPRAQRLHLDAPMIEWEPAGHPLIASTIFDSMGSAKRISNQRRQQKQNSQFERSFLST